MTVTAVLIASGQSVGLTEHQQLLTWVEGESLLEHVMRQVVSWPVDERIVVLGHDADTVIEALEWDGFTVVVDYDWELGPMSSLRAALDHVMRRTGSPSAVLVCHANQPEFPSDAIDLLLEEEGSLAVVPVYRYERGYPVLLRSGLWDRLMSSDDTTELLTMLETVPNVSEVRIDALPARRIDTDRALTFVRPDTQSGQSH